MKNTEKKIVGEEKKKEVIKLVLEVGKSKREAGRLLNIPESTVRFIVNSFQKRGTIEKKNRSENNSKKMTPKIEETLKKMIDDNNPYSLQDIMNTVETKVNSATVRRWLKRLNYSWKLIKKNTEIKNDETIKNERISYIKWYQNLKNQSQETEIIFIDENKFNLHLIKSHFYKQGMENSNLVSPKSSNKNLTLILAINNEKIIYSESIMHLSVDGITVKHFMNSLKKCLENDKKFIVVMNNYIFGLLDSEFAEDYPFEIQILPSYSPFLNPCQKIFSRLKNSAGRGSQIVGLNDLVSAMEKSLSELSKKSISKSIGDSESYFNDCLEMKDID